MQARTIGGITARKAAAKWEAMYAWRQWNMRGRVRLISQQQSDTQDSHRLTEKKECLAEF